MYYKGYKVRIYPNKEQEELIWRHIGACRFIWNYMLALQKTRYENEEKHLSNFDMIRLLPSLKKDPEYAWLNDIANSSLNSVCMSLAKTYQNFFKKNCGFPRFKTKRKSNPTYPLGATVGIINFDESKVRIPKLGRVKYKSDFQIPLGAKKKFIHSTISYVNGKFILSFCLECETQAFQLTEKRIGIDLGIKELAVAAIENEKMIFHNINKSKKMKRLNETLKKLNRKVSRKYEHSKRMPGEFRKTNNIIRVEERIRKTSKRITNIRENYIHQTTNTLVSLLPKRIVMEDLDVQIMLKNKWLSRQIQEQCFYEFIRQMKYKCERRGIELVQVPKGYPSSRLCSQCGSYKKDLKLSDRIYICPTCNLSIDRDYNAAINLMRYEA